MDIFGSMHKALGSGASTATASGDVHVSSRHQELGGRRIDQSSRLAWTTVLQCTCRGPGSSCSAHRVAHNHL